MVKTKVLLVDDEQEILNLLRQIVMGMGCEALLAGNGEKALEILRIEDVDVMVTDMVMPGIDGWTLATRVKEAYPDVRIVGISGRVEPRFEAKSPFDRFVGKPFSPKALRKEIQDLASEKIPSAHRVSPAPTLRRLRVCIAGEESIVTQTLRGFLADLGHQVVAVSSPHELLDRLASHPVDLVITDLQMPGDIEPIREVHQQHPDVAVVMMTAGHPPLSMEEALSCGVYAYLHKPISLIELELLLVRLAERDSEEESGQ